MVAKPAPYEVTPPLAPCFRPAHGGPLRYLVAEWFHPYAPEMGRAPTFGPTLRDLMHWRIAQGGAGRTWEDAYFARLPGVPGLRFSPRARRIRA
jgi:hypothetical protein